MVPHRSEAMLVCRFELVLPTHETPPVGFAFGCRTNVTGLVQQTVVVSAIPLSFRVSTPSWGGPEKKFGTFWYL